MNVFADGPGLSILIAAVLILVIFRRPLLWLGKLLVRSLLGLGFLALWSQSGLAAGLALGVNAFNAVTLGLLGLPGLGLLLLFRWVGT
ncbi:MAG: pro-sigmaK processing inhibitor BofA family protein [Evtepia sp.]|uniref:pro-sigmaK processing inhibitor BofA family protein n=1 Tax=Evtepia sp. TaxID=2773933 RepID=UPI002984A7BA|nr:pro-sigmaK processing inhibitor BofA family protein [Evtepia sp.]MDD7290053.1 pro-sigmaK processing inhibitor BofA family protein [Clostridiales bacterium]MDY3992777.1 pro-sigmaK processing inhibitor BofA family protein [Evtepia sp.]MDY4429979.1 pro-sigmaK processing inhibitor BofA family protein [Evtepia sp.]